MTKIIIELKRCRDCKYYNKDLDLLDNIAKDIVRQLQTLSVTISSNRIHIRRIYVSE